MPVSAAAEEITTTRPSPDSAKASNAACAIERAVQVGLDVLAPLVVGEVLGAVDRVDDPRVCDHRITTAEDCDGVGNARPDGARVAHVERGSDTRSGHPLERRAL